MRIILVLSVVLLGARCGVTPPAFSTGGGNLPAEAGKTYHWRFDETPENNLPGDFISVLGNWVVEDEGSAPSGPRVLRQKGVFAAPDYPRVIVKDLTFKDLGVKVRCRPESGAVDQACGLMFRVRDSENYYITRANALEGNVRLYRVVNGNREQLATADSPVTAGEWHALEATADGEQLTVSWNGTPVITASDTTFNEGKVGLWTKADSVTAFDDLEATAR
ncbi:MAG: family 16 glycoside hydrolase [Myxococcota bacterium]